MSLGSILKFQGPMCVLETYTGTWLPEPVDTSADPGIGAERGQALKLAVLLLLEKLSPTERAAYVLREAFDYPYDEIGFNSVQGCIGRARTIPACLHSSARTRIRYFQRAF